MHSDHFRDAEALRAGAAMPLLRAGRHHATRDGLCLLEYVSVLDGDHFNDHPRSVDPTLAALGRLINDTLSEQARPRLAEHAPELIGTRTRPRTPHAQALRAAAAIAVADAGILLAPDQPCFWRLSATARRLQQPDRGRPGRWHRPGGVLRWTCGRSTLVNLFLRLKLRLPTDADRRDQFLLELFATVMRGVRASLTDLQEPMPHETEPSETQSRPSDRSPGTDSPVVA